MTGTWNRIDPIRQIEFANAVAVEIERVLARQGKVTNSDAVVAAGRIAGAVAAAVALLAPTDIRAIDTMQERLPGMASRFVRILAAEAAERSARTRLSSAHRAQGTDVQPVGSGDLDAMRVEDWAGRVAGSTFLQQNLGISRSTLHRWQRSLRCAPVAANMYFPWPSSSTAGRLRVSRKSCPRCPSHGMPGRG
ncbi:hypothetical protein [Mesorhizobium sp. M1329]|uniref:antitoxin Xre/MbcA/ParS-like domain-containing protein n=1 Tax=Mesorhizobium sp. M1329 TaxID=2957083 RepID=UPI003336C891